VDRALLRSGRRILDVVDDQRGDDVVGGFRVGQRTVAGDPAKTGQQIADARPDDWRTLLSGLHARFLTGDFERGMQFVTRIAVVAEEATTTPMSPTMWSSPPRPTTSPPALPPGRPSPVGCGATRPYRWL